MQEEIVKKKHTHTKSYQPVHVINTVGINTKNTKIHQPLPCKNTAETFLTASFTPSSSLWDKQRTAIIFGEISFISVHKPLRTLIMFDAPSVVMPTIFVGSISNDSRHSIRGWIKKF